MKLKLVIILLLLNNCTTNTSKNEFNKNIVFTENMTIEEFKLKLNEYALISPFPDVKN
tara:strand:- start:412 stop:585 length:174 start_codon:yes stop_codon:yes gene_type:complete